MFDKPRAEEGSYQSHP